MAVYTVTNEGFVPELGLPEGAEEILQNVACIMSSRRGTMPMSRDIGLSYSWIGKPLNVAQVQIIAELADAISQQEPRAQLEAVTCAEGADPASDIIFSAQVVIVNGE